VLPSNELARPKAPNQPKHRKAWRVLAVNAGVNECGPSKSSTIGEARDTDVQSQRALLVCSEVDWLTKAARLPGKSLHLAVALAYLASAQNTRQVVLSNLVTQQFGLPRGSKYRALGCLENADLIRVERKIGRSPLVTICQRPDST
jgi:hypothetical protein